MKGEEIHKNLMSALTRGAEKEFRELVSMALNCQTDSPKVYSDLANVLGYVEFFPGAIALYQKALALNPSFSRARNSLAWILQEQGSYQEALQQYQEAYRLDPGNLTALWGELLFLPTIYESEAEIQAYRQRWRQNIEVLLDRLSLENEAEIDRALEALYFHTNFLLAYQGDDILKEARRYGELISRIAKAKFPQFQASSTRRQRASGEKMRVGFVSTFFFNHSIFKTHGEWVTRLDKKLFEVYTFYLSDIEDAASDKILSQSDFFIKTGSHDERLIAKIAECNLDVLIYLDIGMRPFVQLLAALRLAPVQCNALGHPVTSGLATIDYMLSAALMEPEDADQQYSEKLVRLPNLSSYYPYPPVEKAVRPAFLKEKEEGELVFLNVQNLQKLLPQHDSLYPKLALRVPRSKFHFIGTAKKMTLQGFQRRLEQAFAAFGLEASKFCVFHPSMPHHEFLGLLQYGDVVLDSLDWSGFNSTMEALACDKPVVTCPGSSCRSRHTSAILTMLGMPELIAHNVEEYLRIAETLSQKSYREQVVEKIKANKMRLFNDQAAIFGLELFLENASCFQ